MKKMDVEPLSDKDWDEEVAQILNEVRVGRDIVKDNEKKRLRTPT